LRIWLSDAPAAPEISCAGPCRVHPDTGPEKRVGRLAHAEASILPGGIRLGDQTYKCSSLELQAEGGGRIRVGNRAYAGAVRLLRGADRVVTVNALDMESYLLGVLGCEMPGDWPREALKAQAVAARTYALYFQLQRAGFEWHVTNTMGDQVYDGGEAKSSVADAVNATRGVVLLHDGGVFPAFFHSTCGGRTESPGKALGKPEYDFLEGVPCGFCGASPHYKWSARIRAKDLVAKLRSSGIAVGPVTCVSAVAGDDPQAGAGYAGRSVRLAWPGGEIAAPIVDFRRAMGTLTVQSGKFDCRAQGDEFLFTGRGLGHGAGMCQYGCKGMAEAGRSYREILMYYYRHTTLQKLY
jgi:stage II sporulation protein D